MDIKKDNNQIDQRSYLTARMHAAEALLREEKHSKKQHGSSNSIDCNNPERKDIWKCVLKLIRQWYYTMPNETIKRILKTGMYPVKGFKKVNPIKTLKKVYSGALKKDDKKANPVKALSLLREHRPLLEEELLKEYKAKHLDKVKDTFILYRIIGNDLYPRHEKGQSRANVRFILEHEEDLPGCERRWILNRIVDSDERREIIKLLDSYKEQYEEITFYSEEFCSTEFDVSSFPYAGFLSSKEFFNLGPERKQRAYTAAYRNKNNYVMNNNGARNVALNKGREQAKWVLPWDGNCFITKEAWKEIRETVGNNPHIPYFIVPMQRVTDNTILIHNDTKDLPTAEPQIIFRYDTSEIFNENHPYGRRPKVELIKRLGVPGPWDKWRDDPWDQKSREPSVDSGKFLAAGRVVRLASGVSHLEVSGKKGLKGRGMARQEGIVSTINTIMQNKCSRKETYGLSTFRYRGLAAMHKSRNNKKYDLPGIIAEDIIKRADNALKREPSSVVDKTEVPPSGNMHDYYHPAPYWWPNPKTKDGMPYIKHDGKRVPGTGLNDTESKRYDRTRLQNLFDDSITLLIAWFVTGDKRYAEHAAQWFRKWFINEKTRMNPHLCYAQVRWGHLGNLGQPRGIIEMKDLYYYLDAVRLLVQSEAISTDEISCFNNWLGNYFEWLTTSSQGVEECKAENNHGTYYDLQVASIAAYIEDNVTLYRTLIRARNRFAAQYSPEGVPVKEMNRTQTAHYCCFNLQGWLNLAEIARRHGDNLTHYKSNKGGGLQNAVKWLSSHYGREWPYQQIEYFDKDRFIPIFTASKALGLDILPKIDTEILKVIKSKSCFNPHDGIRPFWNIDAGISTVKD